MRSKIYSIVFIIILTLITVLTVNAEYDYQIKDHGPYYSWVDKNNILTFGDTPPQTPRNLSSPIIYVRYTFHQMDFADYKFEFINKKDCSYANVDRGVIRVRVLENKLLNAKIYRHVAKAIWFKFKQRSWYTGSVFFYIRNQPWDMGAYYVVELGKGGKILKEWKKEENYRKIL